MKNNVIEMKASQHQRYTKYSAASMLLPFAGIIIGVRLNAKKNKLDIKLGEHCIALGILSLIVYIILFFILRVVMAIDYDFSNLQF